MVKTVYLYDGTPRNVISDWDYPNESYTEIPPYPGIWQPFYFDPEYQRWIGAEPPLKNSDLAILEEAINSQNEKLKLFIERSNKIETHNHRLLKYVGDILFQIAHIRQSAEIPGNPILVPDVQYMYDAGIYTNFTIKLLVDNGSLTKRNYQEITGEEYPVYVDENE
ncbi:XkdX family protein [Mammaliicoccus vitulinus]|uniref:XkdX family protein n=1 Tax=Mammaliicoccus vitulinus TaxID=71237 RepID=UPI0039B08AF4